MFLKKKRVSLKTPLLPREKYLVKLLAASVRGKTQFSPNAKPFARLRKQDGEPVAKLVENAPRIGWHQHGFLAVSGIFTLYTHSNAQYVRNETATCS